MADLILQDPRMEIPELFEPGRFPPGQLVLKDSTATRDCIFASAGDRDLSHKRNDMTTVGVPISAGRYNFASPSRTTGVLKRGGCNGLITMTGSDPFTLVAVVTPRSYVSLAALITIGYDMSAGAPGGGELRSIIQFNSNYYFWGSSADWDTGIAYDTDNQQHIVAVAKSGASSLSFWRDGRERASTSSLTGGLNALDNSATNNLIIGSGHPSAATGPDMLWGGGAVFKRRLSPAELASITRDFYNHMFDPA